MITCILCRLYIHTIIHVNMIISIHISSFLYVSKFIIFILQCFKEASHFAAILASRRVQISGRKAALFDGHSVSITGGWPSLVFKPGGPGNCGIFWRKSHRLVEQVWKLNNIKDIKIKLLKLWVKWRLKMSLIGKLHEKKCENAPSQLYICFFPCFFLAGRFNRYYTHVKLIWIHLRSSIIKSLHP